MSQCAYSMDGETWTDLPVGPQFDLALSLLEENIELITDGGKIWRDRLFERDQWELTFKLRYAHVAAFRAMHDAVDGQMNRLFLTLDRTADPIVAIYGWKEAGFVLAGTGEPVVPPVFNYRLTISGETMSLLTLLRSYMFADLPATTAAGTIARVMDAPGGIWMFSGLRWIKVGNYINVQDSPYNCVGDGTTNDSPGMQQAITDAVIFGLPVYVPSTAAGYRLDTALDCHNTDRLKIFGDGALHPAFGLKDIAPANGSILIGNTGPTGSIVDSVGANNFTLQGVTLSALGAPSPSRIGIVTGTSDRSDAGAPGSAFHDYNDVAIYLPQSAGTTIGIYANNLNLSGLRRVTVLADLPLIFETANPRTIVPPFGTFGADIGNDGNITQNLSLLAWGVAAAEPALWLHKVNNIRGDVYIASMNGGPGYSGFRYAIYSAGCFDLDLDLEIDYFPSCIYMEEFHDNIRLEGTTFPGTTDISVDIPIIAFFHGAFADHCEFKITPVMGALPLANFHYSSTGGGVAVPQHIKNSTFIFDSVASPNVLFFNMTADEAVPLWSNRIEGDTDAITNNLLVNGAAMDPTAYRMFLNGLQIGSA